MLCIKEISYWDYLTGFPLDLPTLGKYFVRQSQINGGLLLAVYIDDRPVGIAVAEFASPVRLTYVFIEEQFRGKGFGTRLLQEALSCARNKLCKKIKTGVVLQNEYGETIDHILIKTGFSVLDTAKVIRYANDEKCRTAWTEFMGKRGGRICNYLEMHGFRTLSFAEAPPQVFRVLKEHMGREFGISLNPFRFIDNNKYRIAAELSFITLKEDEPAAFVTVTMEDDRALTVRQLAAAGKYQGYGAFLMPFAALMNCFLAQGTYNKGAAVVFDGNRGMRRLVDGFMGQMAESIKTLNIYYADIG